MVRDAAIRNCDALLQPQAGSPVARRWKGLAAGESDLRTVIPDAVDEAVFGVLQAIAQGLLRLKDVSRSGREVDLNEEGQGELSGWYMGSGGWRAMYSAERFVDDFAGSPRKSVGEPRRLREVAEPTKSGTRWLSVASANTRLLAPSTATNSSTSRTSPVFASTMRGFCPA